MIDLDKVAQTTALMRTRAGYQLELISGIGGDLDLNFYPADIEKDVWRSTLEFHTYDSKICILCEYKSLSSEKISNLMRFRNHIISSMTKICSNQIEKIEQEFEPLKFDANFPIDDSHYEFNFITFTCDVDVINNITSLTFYSDGSKHEKKGAGVITDCLVAKLEEEQANMFRELSNIIGEIIICEC